jgi:hypothetical protein
MVASTYLGGAPEHGALLESINSTHAVAHRVQPITHRAPLLVGELERPAVAIFAPSNSWQ